MNDLSSPPVNTGAIIFGSHLADFFEQVSVEPNFFESSNDKPVSSDSQLQSLLRSSTNSQGQKALMSFRLPSKKRPFFSMIIAIAGRRLIEDT